MTAPSLWVSAAGREVPEGGRAEVVGRGDLCVRAAGHPPGEVVELSIGRRVVEVVADDDGVATWTGWRLLAQVAGEICITDGARSVVVAVRPTRLVAEAIAELVAELEAAGEGLAQDAGAVSTLGGLRSREEALRALDEAVGLAAAAAPAIRRRPIQRAREVVRAVSSERGARTAADVRWLANHPAQALRAAAVGRSVGVVRERQADLDTLENRGVLAAYDRLDAAVGHLQGLVGREIERLDEARPAREAFLTETGNLWLERDQPRHDALSARRARLMSLATEARAVRARAGLPDLHPRGTRMVRTPRVDAEPAYWATFRAFEIAERAAQGALAPSPAPVRALDELWEQWVAVAVSRALQRELGPPSSGAAIDVGWFTSLRRGVVAAWQLADREVRLWVEPEYAWGRGEVQKLFAGRPWRPDLVIEVIWADGRVDLHVIDAKFRLEDGGAPREALSELWWRYGEGIGDAARRPLVRSLWVVAPGDALWLVAPGMLGDGWPAERLRGGCVSIRPGRVGALGRVVARVVSRG